MNLFISYFEREDFIQIECRTTSLLDCYAEMQLILCKGNNLIHSIQQKGVISLSTPTTIVCFLSVYI